MSNVSLRVSWGEEQIMEVLAPALGASSSRVHFDTLSDAERFRYACYSLRKRQLKRKQTNGTNNTSPLSGLSFILAPVTNDNGETKFEVLIMPTPTLKSVKT